MAKPIGHYKCYSNGCQWTPTHWYWPQTWRQGLPSCDRHGSRLRREALAKRQREEAK